MRLSRKEFVPLVQRAYDQLPPQFKEAMDNVVVLVEYWPSPEDLEDSDPDDRYSLLGLYTGVPLTERGSDLPPLPDKITLFQRPIEASCSSLEDVVEQVRVTLLHEIGHYLGMTEDDLHRHGFG